MIDNLHKRGNDIGFYGDGCGLRITNEKGDDFISPGGSNQNIHYWLQGYRCAIDQIERERRERRRVN